MPYVLAGQRGEGAIAANAAKSDRAIAAEIGVSDKTVAKARKRTADKSAVGKRAVTTVVKMSFGNLWYGRFQAHVPARSALRCDPPRLRLRDAGRHLANAARQLLRYPSILMIWFRK